jgi:hypothetical protein
MRKSKLRRNSAADPVNKVRRVEPGSARSAVGIVTKSDASRDDDQEVMPNAITSKAMKELEEGRAKRFYDSESLFRDLHL